MKAINWAGVRSGFLTFTKRAEGDALPVKWNAECICGKHLQISTANIRKTKSCGCKNANRKHFKRDHKRAYSIWQSMLARTRYSERDCSKKYVEKGIAVDPRWLSFANFLADMGDPPDKHSIDRINCEGDYTKENCRWASDVVQAKNRKSTNWFAYNGTILTTTELAQASGVPRTTIQAAIKSGRLEAFVIGAVLVSKGSKGTTT